MCTCHWLTIIPISSISSYSPVHLHLLLLVLPLLLNHHLFIPLIPSSLTPSLFSFSSLLPPLRHLLTSDQFEVAVRKATGEPPVFPGTLLALKNLPHRFKWLRKSTHTDIDTEVEVEVEKQLEGEVKIEEDDRKTKEQAAQWRGSWIKILKHDILNPRSSS